MTEILVRDILRPDVVTLTEATPIRRAVALLVDNKTPAGVVVSDDGSLLGILTQKDCFRPALKASYYQEWSGTVADHMSHSVITIAATDNLIVAAEMFLNSPHRVFPVTEGTALAGILHRSDVLAALSRAG
jgi:CBS domain-containing protein